MTGVLYFFMCERSTDCAQLSVAFFAGVKWGGKGVVCAHEFFMVTPTLGGF